MGINSLRFYTLSLGILCLLIALIGCGNNEIPALENRGYVYIGLVIPRSGPLAEYGETIIRGAHLAVEAINEKGGVRSRPIKLLIRDEMDYKSDPGFGGLPKDPRVSVIIGHLLESAFQAARVPYLQSRHPVLLPFLSGDDVSRSGSGLFFRLIASDSAQARALAWFPRDTLTA
ncbi:MAG: amino acid ABC transporter substrate-binding protein, partial [Deltaproteobacteria bacterium]|nr:amino acid ABC transporter substrate-binding protein [Deltaproteobacteria bacterium]